MVTSLHTRCIARASNVNLQYPQLSPLSNGFWQGRQLIVVQIPATNQDKNISGKSNQTPKSSTSSISTKQKKRLLIDLLFYRHEERAREHSNHSHCAGRPVV